MTRSCRPAGKSVGAAAATRRVGALLLAVVLGSGLFGASDAAAQAGVWWLDGRVRVTVKARGRVASEAAEVSGALLRIYDDGTYDQPGTFLCLGDDFYAAEEGTWRPLGRRGNRFRLDPANTDALLDDAEDCLVGVGSIDIEARTYFHKAQIRKDGSLRLKTVFRGRLVIDGHRFPFRAVGRFSGRADGANLSIGTITPAGQLVRLAGALGR